MWRQIRIILAVGCVFLPISLGATDSNNPFSFADSTIRISSTAQDGSAEITLRSSAELSTPPTIRDFDLPRPSAAMVIFELIKDDKPHSNSWRFKATVTGLSPANALQQRYAVIEYADDKTQTISYLLTNQPAGSFAWVISKPPDPWVASPWLPDSACTGFVVTPKGSPATGITLGSVSLIEQNTKEAITVDDLLLCRDGRCGAPFDLPADVPSRLQLCTTRSFHGNFHGGVTLAALQKLDGDIILQNLDFSSFITKSFGVIVIGAGVFLAWWSKIWARARLERDQALMPALVMRTQLRTLQQVLGQLRQPYRDAPTNLKTAIETLLGELTDTVLDESQFLPPKFPSPYGYSVDAAGYKAYLEARNPKVQLYAVLVRQGVVGAEAQDNGTLTQDQQVLVRSAIVTIDKISVSVPLPTADQATAQIQLIEMQLQNKLFPGLEAPAAAPPANQAREYESLSLEIRSISKGVWLLYGILTTLSGTAVLILNNPGFGVPLDLLFAFFWGFSLPTTIGALAPGSAATALNIPIAKA
jgi:hypothetical protein